MIIRVLLLLYYTSLGWLVLVIAFSFFLFIFSGFNFLVLYHYLTQTIEVWYNYLAGIFVILRVVSAFIYFLLQRAKSKDS